MKTAIVIPARYGSRRLPGKPLLRTTGKYLIQHVYERACQSRRASRVVVATDDPRIEAAVASFGGEVVMTRRNHPSGTDRVAEVARQLDTEVIVNLQGDEPLIEPATLDQLADLVYEDRLAEVATLATPFNSLAQWQDPNCVKVVCDERGRALYFSRSPIPHVRDGQPDFAAEPSRFLLHLGLYAYRRAFLLHLAASRPSPLEQLEKLEQLRILAMGRPIRVGLTRHAAVGVDTMDDYERFVQRYRQCGRLQAA
jgi:3-deoxy-manno-octulosonate cytidylyltransferase (CMP-KDO synthetase)